MRFNSSISFTFKYQKMWLIVLVAILSLAACDSNADTTVDSLRCRNIINPEGVDFPTFSWEIQSTSTGVSQTAWEIEIATQERLLQKGEADIWQSGKQLSDTQFNVTPNVTLSESTPYYWRVRIWDNNGEVTPWSEPAYFSTSLNNESSWSAKWMTYPYSNDRPLPYFRKEFSLDKRTPVKALLHFCGLGSGEVYLNGEKIDQSRFLDAAQTDYDHYALYSTLEVSDHLQKGENCIGVMLGNGWFTQGTAWLGAPFSYGSPMFRLQMVVTFDDGSQSIIESDDSWTWKEGPILKTNMYFGEIYDARQETENWSMPGISQQGWIKALPATENMPPQLSPQLISPIRKKEILETEKIWQDSTGNWIYDFGVNVAGIPMLEVTQPAGTHIVMRFSEDIDAQGGLNFNSTGWIHHGEIFKDEYICKGTPQERWSPRFTYHGYRYAELSGFEGKPDQSTLKLVVVHSDIEQSGTFECADEQINQLHEMALRTVKSNLHGTPTDCPIREKCGWLGDVHAYVKMANLNFQMDNFWQKYMEDIRTGSLREEENTLFHERYNNTFYFVDKPAGLPYMIAPGKRLCGVASPDWGTVVVQLPWWMYVYQGNQEILEKFYPMMKQWTEYVNTLAKNKDRTQKYNPNTSSIVYQGLGDWCAPTHEGVEKTPVEFTSTAFHYLDTHIMEQVALLLGKNEDAAHFAAQKQAIANEVVSIMYDSEKKTFGSQTADALALDLGFVPSGDEVAVANSIVLNMKEKSGGFMHAGIFGLCRIGSMLARHGNAQAAWDMFTKKGENSFEWMWKTANATTLWETLPINESTRQSAASGSHNHPMQAGYDVTFFEDIAGIRPDASGYGFKVIRFQPLFCDHLPWAKASIRSPYGKVSSSWKTEDNHFQWEISIPANTTGIVDLPFEGEVTVNGKNLLENGITAIEATTGSGSYRFPSGTYKINIQK